MKDKSRELSIVNTKKELLEVVSKSFTIENIDNLVKTTNIIVDSLKKGGTVYVCGNGGSAEQANHFVGEMVGRLQKKMRSAYKFESLCSNTATITALANDLGYEAVFEEQLIGRFDIDKDVLICLSTSGKSENVIHAARDVSFEKGFVVSLVGVARCELGTYSDVLLTVESTVTERIQEVHLMYLHEIARMVEEEMEK